MKHKKRHKNKLDNEINNLSNDLENQKCVTLQSNITALKDKIKKLSTFQYYSYEFGMEENISDRKFITPLNDILQVIIKLFDYKNNPKFTDLFYEIYSYNPENDN